MAHAFRTKTARALLVAAGIVALAGCGSKEPTYEADATDKSGGEMIVEDASSPAVDVTLPETPMTNVPPEGETPPPATPAAPAPPAQ